MATDTMIELELDGISKRFGGVQAVDGVSLAIERGSIHALVGENGAGKSTLGKIIGGAVAPDEGVMRLDGADVRYRSPRDALRDGIAMIAQEPSLVPQRSVMENVFLGMEAQNGFVFSRRSMRKRYDSLVGELGFSLPPDLPAGRLRVADQLRVEVLRAVARRARLIILDEPTSALARDDAEKLFREIQRLRAAGATLIYISHFLEEVLRLADRVSILRDGKVVRTSPASDETPTTLVTGMIGRPVSLVFPTKQPPATDAPVLCAVSGVCADGVDNVSFTIREGEILGLTGLVGSGRSELARAIFGADRRLAGEVVVRGEPLNARTPSDAIRAGVAMLPEDRKNQGLHMQRAISDNVSLPHLGKLARFGIMNVRREHTSVGRLLAELEVRADPAARVVRLSGGNQQRVLFAKWLLERPVLLIADEPTRGVDVAAKQQIYRLLASLAEHGMAVLFISSELEEIIGLAHRVLVMRTGRIVAELDGAKVTENAIMHAAFATSTQSERKNGYQERARA